MTLTKDIKHVRPILTPWFFLESVYDITLHNSVNKFAGSQLPIPSGIGYRRVYKSLNVCCSMVAVIEKRLSCNYL